MTEDVRILGVERSSLLEPIAAHRPGGESLRYEPVYDRIREARREDDPALPQGDWKTELKVADWRAVRDLSVEALASRTKDLQIAAWLCEALCELHGPEGLREGIGLVADLCDRFWKDLYPSLDDEEFRLIPLEWLDQQLAVRLRGTRITASAEREALDYTFDEWGKLLYRENLLKAGRPVDDGGEEERLRRDRIELAWARTSPAFFRARLEALAAVLRELDRLEAILVERVGDGAPRFRRLRESADDVVKLLRRVAPPAAGAGPELAGEPAGPGPEEANEGAGEAGTAAADPSPAASRAPGADGWPASRAEAYRRLAQLSDYLIKTEPHSPSGYLVRRAVAWGHKGLPEVLQEIVKEPGDLQSIFELLGMTGQQAAE